MHAKKRYLLTTVSAGCLILFGYWSLWSPGSRDDADAFRLQPRSYHGQGDLALDQDVHVSAAQRRQAARPPDSGGGDPDRDCRMETCFDFGRCRDGFKVYVYPTTAPVSGKYEEILRAVRESPYATDDPAEACVLIPSVDTLDRDRLSKDGYVPDIERRMAALAHWDGGRNHFVFNLYAGSWPEYAELDYGFDPGRAMVAQASVSNAHYRPGFDVSFPLFHREHDFRGGEPGYLRSNDVPPVREYTLTFKGKRYLTGIGSETRNSLYHIHNDKDIILLTTCKHGKEWRSIMDERCEKDNEDYDKYDFKTLLHKSTFCLVPRGRRLGSYRFLEALQAACVPVLLSNNWVLPFSEIIDWNKAVIWADERLILQVPSIVRSINHADILSLRQQSQFIWDTYFSSIEKIIYTTLEILKDRVNQYMSRTAFVWNTAPGALYYSPEYSQDLAAYPFFLGHLAASPSDRFTAVIYAQSVPVIVMSPIYRLIKSISRSKYLSTILFLWHCEKAPPPEFRWPVPRHIKVVYKFINSIQDRFTVYPEIDTDAVLSLDEDSFLLTDEVDFAFHVWQHFPSQLIGYIARGHYYDDGQGEWRYSSKWTNDYSMVLTASAFYHKYYGYLYFNWLSPAARELVDQSQNCEDILMNFLVSHVTKLPPIKLTQRRYQQEAPPGGSLPRNGSTFSSRWLSVEHFSQRQRCLNAFPERFGYMPLVRSSMRFDPLFFKDPVSRTRKKYRQIDLMP